MPRLVTGPPPCAGTVALATAQAALERPGAGAQSGAWDTKAQEAGGVSREPLAVVLLEAEAQTDTETEEFRVRDTVPVALRDLRLLLLRLWLALPE